MVLRKSEGKHVYMCINMRVIDMRIDMRVDARAEMRVHKRMDTSSSMCVDMRTDICGSASPELESTKTQLSQ